MKAEDVIPLHVADVTYPAQHPLAGQTGSVMAFVVRHTQGLLLVDTGIGFGNPWIDEQYQPKAWNIKDAMYRKRLDADAVVMVVNTHLHFDHSGQNVEFPEIPILVQQPEWEAAWEEGYTMREWIDFEEANYLRVRGDTEIAPDLRLIFTPGHSPGHQSLAVDTEDGLVLIVGQAAQDAKAFATAPADPSLQRLRDLNAAFVHFSHDRAVLKKAEKHGEAKNQ
jgi:glyoxylase-like metal-dependent hydrolase (beta-lactamase superfamily II)